jgi:hypothetical protein
VSSPALAVLFTMNCMAPARARRVNLRPRTWTMSARSIDSFCSTLLSSGQRPTLFCALPVVANHTPLLEEYADAGAEIGLLLDPADLHANLRHQLGHYGRDDQREIVRASIHHFTQLFRSRPRSVRTVEFSASDDTFGVLRDSGFLQGSVSSPGRRVSKYQAMWEGAIPDPHLAARDDKLGAGDLEFLEIPVTTDANQSAGGVAPELNLDIGDFSKWHWPLAQGQLDRMEREGVGFRALCWLASNGAPYGDSAGTSARALASAIDYVDTLHSRFEVRPLTVAAAHTDFRREVTTAC